MTDRNRPNTQHPVAKKGLITKVIDTVFKVIGVLLFSVMMSVLIEWVGMLFYYPDAGYRNHEHAVEMMQKEMNYLGSALARDAINGELVQAVSSRVSGTVNYLFIDSGLLDRLASAKTSDVDDGGMKRFLKGLAAEYFDYLMAAIYILIMFLIRLSILVLSIPAFVLFGLVGVADGLMQRDLRRWSGGNESGYLYHWAKRFAMPVLFLAWVIYLTIPNSIHPNCIITPFAILFGIVLMVMSSKFKKYL